MPLTELDIKVLLLIAQYYLLTREQIQTMCFPNHASGRNTRKRLSRLRQGNFINRHAVAVNLPGTNGAAPVYYPTKNGAELLASYFDNDEFLATNTQTPRADRLAHWIAINETRHVIQQALDVQQDIQLVGWLNEWETVNKSASDSERFYLHTQLRQEPPLSCSPDAAFLLSFAGQQKVFYLEQDRGTSSPKQVIARKFKGYSELAERQLHRRHFEDTTLATFSILTVTTNAYRARAMSKEIAARKTRPELWLFVDKNELTPDSFLNGEIFLNQRGESGRLLKRNAIVTQDQLQEIQR